MGITAEPYWFSSQAGTEQPAYIQEQLDLNILVLSPHRDDAAFSLALSISRWRASGHKVTILNVFSRSLYAPYSDADTVHENDRLSYVSALRRREDEAFLKQVPGTAMVDLNLKDAPIRLRCDAAIVCDMEVNPDDPAIAKIRKTVAGMVEGKDAGAFGALVLPLALGHHVDHRVVRDAARPVSTHIPCAFYEDLPYATRPGVAIDLSRFREDTASRLHEPLLPVFIHGTHTRPAEFKRRVAGLYASQIDGELAGTIAQFCHRYQGAERLWANAAWLATKPHLSSLQPDPEAEPLPV